MALVLGIPFMMLPFAFILLLTLTSISPAIERVKGSEPTRVKHVGAAA